MNDTRSDLMRAIITSPDDDAPRLVFADWLDENGEGDRAEFIRVQIEIARLNRDRTETGCDADESFKDCQCETCCRLRPLISRERELFTPYNHDVEWFVLPVPASSQWNFRPAIRYSRGFVDTLCCEWRDWYANADVILSETPLRNVDIFLMPAGLYRSKSGKYVRVLNNLDAEAFLGREWPGISFVVRYFSATASAVNRSIR